MSHIDNAEESLAKYTSYRKFYQKQNWVIEQLGLEYTEMIPKFHPILAFFGLFLSIQIQVTIIFTDKINSNITVV